VTAGAIIPGMHPGIVYDIDTESSPPRMTVCVLGRPLRYASVELERVGRTREDTFWMGIRQFDETDFAIFDAIAVPCSDRSA